MKPIVLLFDGTWNSEARSGDVTNVHLLKNAIIDATARPARPGVGAPRIFYDDGVGTGGPIDKLLGGVAGVGLSSNVKQGYRYLSQYYVPETRGGGQVVEGDQVFIFGFSRGAFTARSLAGFIAASGLLRKEHCSAENLGFAWAYYRTPPADRMPADKAKLEALCYTDLTIRVLGVFDTVGSLGVPTGPWDNWAGSGDKFHDTKIGSAIEIALHALALDEHRGPFVPALFARPDNLAARPIEQVWFPGVHSDVGGGYEDRGNGRTRLSDVALAWMLSRIAALADTLPVTVPTSSSPDLDDPHDSLKGFVVSSLKPMYRLIDGRPMPVPPKSAHNSYRLQPPNVSWKESIHRAVFDLIIETHLDPGRTNYLPPQVGAIAEDLRQGRFSVVDHAGAPMPFADVVDLLDAAEKAIGRPILR
jgi:hypothetical protein